MIAIAFEPQGAHLDRDPFPEPPDRPLARFNQQLAIAADVATAWNRHPSASVKVNWGGLIHEYQRVA